MEEIQKQPIVLQALTNPLAETFTWQYDSANYTLQPGERREFPDYIVTIGAKKIADKLAKTANKEERIVLQRAVLEEREPTEVAKEMGIQWSKVLEAQQIAKNKGKESARVLNLEQQVADLSEKLNKVLETKDLKVEETAEEIEGVDDLGWQDLRRKAKTLGIEGIRGMKKDELVKAVEEKINQ